MTRNNARSHDISSPEFWLREWENTLSGTPYTVHRGYATSRFWDNLAGQYDRDNSDSHRDTRAILDILGRNDCLFDGMRALDIGCGTGTLAIALAGEGAAVTALDFSRGMLGSFEKKLNPKLRDSIDTVRDDWDVLNLPDRGWEKAFDLVVANMTPAVRRPSAFLRMIDASRSACLLKGWAERRRNRFLEELWPLVRGVEMHDRPPDVIYEFNLLYAMGLRPSISIQPVDWERETPVETLVQQYVDYFTGVTDDAEETLRAKIADYFDTVAVDGRVSEHYRGSTGTIFWRVDGEK